MTTAVATNGKSKTQKGEAGISFDPAIIVNPTPLQIPEIRKRTALIRIAGVTPLITNKWSEKAIKQMRDAQTKAAKTAKGAKDAAADTEAATYYLISGCGVGFPAIGFKKAMVDAAVALGSYKTVVRRAFHIITEEFSDAGMMLVPIQFQSKGMREDLVRVGMGKADLRYRPEFRDWHADVPFLYDSNQISLAQIVSLLKQAGFSTGIGEWRPEKDGISGMFDVAEILEDSVA